MALWLERNLDPTLPAERSVEEFCRAFPGATRRWVMKVIIGGLRER